MEAVKVKNIRIKCDADNCDFENQIELTAMESMLNVPCPKCGANLLTKEDLEAALSMFKGINVINALAEFVPEAFETRGEPLNITVNPRAEDK